MLSRFGVHGTSNFLQTFDHAVLGKRIHAFQKACFNSLIETPNRSISWSDVRNPGFPFLQGSVLQNFFKVVEHFRSSSLVQFHSMTSKTFFNMEETFDRSFTIENRCFVFTTRSIVAVLSQFHEFKFRLHEIALVFNTWRL
jgi:hypothetical protein